MERLGEIRAADADREAVADALRAHCSAGRLDVPELEERLSAALTARTIADLDRLVADLPGGRPLAPASVVPSATPVRPGLPGLRAFHQRHLLDVSLGRAFEQAVTHIVPAMVRVGYDVVAQSEPHMLAFECREHPAWVPFACIFLFPVGLVALAFRETQRIVVTFEEVGAERTRVTVRGTARRPVRKAFARLGQTPR